ncbi:hypothetical protein NQ318_002929 [Aromia moschata]|uniref:Uncharacterized protein n=1 Tax=Aromia moschata TaxID=1265417 RepID=A0AAV8XVQ7_9CUCU|nr:hypothetical protein NQ318_002929 [Aromia moschata]
MFVIRTKSVIILLVVCVFPKESICQCVDDECYRHYQNLIGNEKGSIRKTFDGILENYDDIDGILKHLLEKLNTTILNADRNLTNLENDNNDTKNRNKQSNSTLLSLINDKHLVEEKIKKIDGSRNWIQEITDANKTANSVISIGPTLEDVETQAMELEKWKKFLEKFNETNYAKDIMDIPHSVSDDLDLLDRLLSEDNDTSCYDTFQDDLKNLFAQLANILNIDNFKQKLTRLEKRAEKIKNKANDILAKTVDILDTEKILKDVNDLANKTLNLAEDIEDIKNSIDDLSKDNKGIFDDELKELYQKYDINKFRILLDELEDTKKQIEEVAGGENFSIGDLEKEIDDYINEIDYYSCILSDCQYRTPADARNSFNCEKK